MRYRFRLRQLFVVFTAVATCIGINLTFLHALGLPSSEINNAWVTAYALTQLPIYPACTLGALFLFEARSKAPVESRLGLFALSMVILWKILRPVTQFFLITAGSMESVLLIDILETFVSSLIEAACWTLMVLAVLRAATALPVK